VCDLHVFDCQFSANCRGTGPQFGESALVYDSHDGVEVEREGKVHVDGVHRHVVDEHLYRWVMR
jgi:hypothetical protein